MITGPSLCYGPRPAPSPPRRGADRRLRPGGRVAMAGLEWLVSLLRRSPTPVSLASTPRPPLTLSPLPAATSLRPYVTYGLRSYAKPRVGSPPLAAAAAHGIPAGTPPAVATHASATIAPQCSPAATVPPPRLTIEAAEHLTIPPRAPRRPEPLAASRAAVYAWAAASQWRGRSAILRRPWLAPHHGRRSLCRHCRAAPSPPAHTLSLTSAPPLTAAAARVIPAGTPRPSPPHRPSRHPAAMPARCRRAPTASSLRSGAP